MNETRWKREDDVANARKLDDHILERAAGGAVAPRPAAAARSSPPRTRASPVRRRGSATGRGGSPRTSAVCCGDGYLRGE